MPLPDGVSVPKTCPDCDEPWSGWITGPSQDGRIGVQCSNGHDHDFLLSPEDVMAVELSVRAWQLERPGRFSGGPLDGSSMHAPSFSAMRIGDVFRGSSQDGDGHETRYAYRLRSMHPEWLDFEYVGEGT